MDENKEESKEHSSASHEQNAVFKPNNPKNGLPNGISQNSEKNEDIPKCVNAVVTQEKNEILQTKMELQDFIINILQQKLKLSYIRNSHFMNIIGNAVGDVQKTANEAVRKYLDIVAEKSLPEFQVIMEFLDSLKIKKEEDYSVNTEECLEECRRMFVKYEEIYIKSNTHLRDYLKHLMKVLYSNELPNSCVIQARVLFSIFQEKIAKYDRYLDTSEKAFNEFESMLKREWKTSEKDTGKLSNILLISLEKAELAFNILKLLAAELLKVDLAEI